MSVLPSEYQEVDFIKNEGLAYIASGVISNINSSVQAKIKKTSIGFSAMFYLRNEWIKYALLVQNDAGICKLWAYNMGKNSGARQPGKALGDTIYCSLIPDGLYCDHTLVYSLPRSSERRGEILLGAYSNYKFPCEYYGFKIWDGTELVRNYVPCYRKSDYKPGMYDLVNDVFYTNAGTGEFTVGFATDGCMSMWLRRRAMMGQWKNLRFNQLVPDAYCNFTNSITDTRTYLDLRFRGLDSSGTFFTEALGGHHTLTKIQEIITTKIPVNRFLFLHNGAKTNIDLTPVIFEYIPNGCKLFLSCVAESCNPTVINGLVVKNMMVINLTAMYGAGNEPTTVEQVRADCMAIGHDLDVYQPYTPVTE